MPSGWVRTDYRGGTDVAIGATTTATVKKYEINTEFPPGEFQYSSRSVAFPSTGAPPRKQPDLVWGPATKGLQAAVEFMPQQESYAFGNVLGVRFHIRNVSDQTIRFSSELARQDDHPTVLNKAGHEQRVAGVENIIRPQLFPFSVKPGQEAVLDAYPLGIYETEEQGRPFKHIAGNYLVCAPGHYTIRYTVNLGNVVQKDATGKQIVPAEGDWVGTVETGLVPLVVRRHTGGLPALDVNGEEANRAMKESDALTPGASRATAAVARDGGQQSGTEQGWGEPSAGIRCRLMPVAPGTSEDSLAAASTVDRFDQCEDMTFAVELKNVSGQTVRLLGPYYNAQGKSQPDRFGPFLFTFEFQSVDGRSVDRLDQRFLAEDVARMLSQMEVATLDPGQSLRMLLRPGTWRYGQACQLESGAYRTIVRYRGPVGDVGERLKRLNVPAKDAWAAEVASAPVTFTLAAVPPRKQPDLVWGPVTQGLQAAIEFVPQQESYVFGAKADVRFHVRNVSDRAIRFSTEHVRRGDHATVLNEAGREQRVTDMWHSARALFIHFTLKPGQEAVLDAESLGIVETDEQSRQFKHPVGNHLVCAPGHYTIRYAVHLGNVVRKDATGKQTVPVEGDWVGTVETGPVSLVVRRQAGSGLPGLGVNGEEATTVMKESDTLTPEQVVQQQPKGKVTVKFRVASVGLQGWSDERLNEFLQGTMPGGGFSHGSDPPIRLESPVKLPNGGKFYVLLVGHAMRQATKDVQHLAAKEDHESLCVYRLIKPLQKHFTGKTVRATGELEHTKVPRAVREDGTVEGPMSDEYVLRIDSPDGFQVEP
jgi:hypothetical protein